MHMALSQEVVTRALFPRGSTSNRDEFASQTRISAVFCAAVASWQYVFVRISASVAACRLFVTRTSFYASKNPDNQTTRNTICPSKSALPLLSFPSLFRPALNKKSRLFWKFSQSQLRLNWAKSRSGRVIRAPFPIVAPISGGV